MTNQRGNKLFDVFDDKRQECRVVWAERVEVSFNGAALFYGLDNTINLVIAPGSWNSIVALDPTTEKPLALQMDDSLDDAGAELHTCKPLGNA